MQSHKSPIILYSIFHYETYSISNAMHPLYFPTESSSLQFYALAMEITSSVSMHKLLNHDHRADTVVTVTHYMQSFKSICFLFSLNVVDHLQRPSNMKINGFVLCLWWLVYFMHNFPYLFGNTWYNNIEYAPEIQNRDDIFRTFHSKKEQSLQ